jgi:hypothetical protein
LKSVQKLICAPGEIGDKFELDTPTIAMRMPRKMMWRMGQLLGYERFWSEGKLAYSD